MAHKVIAAILTIGGTILIAASLFEMGLFATQVKGAANPVASAPVLSASAPVNDMPHRNGVLAGVHSTTSAGPNTPVAYLSIPRLGIKNAPIFDRGLDAKGDMLIASGYSVTHYQYSAAIGAGNAVLYGHDDIQGSIFARLKDLRTGDLINVLLPGSGLQTTYRVTGRSIVQPTAVQILNPSSDVRLTLFTCYPNWVDTQRVVVVAVPQ